MQYTWKSSLPLFDMTITSVAQFRALLAWYSAPSVSSSSSSPPPTFNILHMVSAECDLAKNEAAKSSAQSPSSSPQSTTKWKASPTQRRREEPRRLRRAAAWGTSELVMEGHSRHSARKRPPSFIVVAR